MTKCLKVSILTYSLRVSHTSLNCFFFFSNNCDGFALKHLHSISRSFLQTKTNMDKWLAENSTAGGHRVSSSIAHLWECHIDRVWILNAPTPPPPPCPGVVQYSPVGLLNLTSPDWNWNQWSFPLGKSNSKLLS